MQKYENKGKDSGVETFETTADSIIIIFEKGEKKRYTYNSTRPGKNHVDKMKELAMKGEGLNEYINRNPEVKNGYFSKT